MAEEDMDTPDPSPMGVVSDRVTLHVSTVSGLRDLLSESTVDVILSFPPGDGGSPEMLRDLASFSAHSLKRTGALLLLVNTQYPPAYVKYLRHDDLAWVCAFHYTHPGRSIHADSHLIPLTQKLVVVMGKSDFKLNAGYEVISVPAFSEGAAGNPSSPRLDVGMELIIQRFTRPGQVVCDPILMGRSETALVVLKHGRIFIGGWHDKTDIERVRARVASITTSVQGGMWGDARMAARRLAWERRARSLLSCVSCSHRSNSSGPNRSRGSISRTTR